MKRTYYNGTCEMQKIIRTYQNIHILEYLKEMDEFIGIYNVAKLNRDKII